MTCEARAEIILDMARGAAAPEAARLSVRRHMETCPSCAAEYTRQRDLTTALQALAAEAQEWQASAAMEHRLLAAFAARQGHEAPVDTRARGGRWRHALATAAALMLAVWGIREAGGPAKRGSGEPTNRRIGAQVGNAAASRTERNAAGARAPFLTPPGVSERSRHASRTVKPPAVSERSEHASRTATSVEFVRIPSAIGLPDLESGTVLRMELPLTALPEYGLQIAPDATRTSVEADVLVGQDGQPRAIRLVGVPDNVAQDSRSRQ